MSRWMVGKVSLKCSLSQLQTMLEKVKPAWKGHIKTSDTSSLTCHRGDYTGQTEGGYDLIVPGSMGGHGDAVPEVGQGDLGFKKASDGTWTFRKGTGARTGNLEGDLKQEFALDTVKQKAKLNNAVLIEEVTDDGKKRLVYHVPVKEKYKLMA